MKVCYLLVTCSREQSRDTMLRKVVESFKEQPSFDEWENDFYVFDNCSTYDGTKELLKTSFKNVFLAEANYGYWSAVNWFATWARSKGYDYVYITESDCIHHDIHQLRDAIALLEKNVAIGMVRTAEFSLVDKHLYDKAQRHPNSRTCEWFSQRNFFTNTEAVYVPTEIAGVFETNLVAKVCGLHRVPALISVLSQLSGWFIEVDFQRFYHQVYPVNAILDGGIYNTTPSYEPNVVAGSWVKDKADENGYLKTREGFVDKVEEMKVRE